MNLGEWQPVRKAVTLRDIRPGELLRQRQNLKRYLRGDEDIGDDEFLDSLSGVCQLLDKIVGEFDGDKMTPDQWDEVLIWRSAP